MRYGVVSSIKFLFIVSSKEVHYVWCWMEKHSTQRGCPFIVTDEQKARIEAKFQGDGRFTKFIDYTHSYWILVDFCFQPQEFIKLNDLRLVISIPQALVVRLWIIGHKFFLHSKEDETTEPHYIQDLKSHHTYPMSQNQVVNNRSSLLTEAGGWEGDRCWEYIKRQIKTLIITWRILVILA